MQHNTAARLIEEKRHEYQLHSDNVQIINADIANLNRAIQDNVRTTETQAEKVREPLERQQQTFTQKNEHEFDKAKQRITDIRRLFETEQTKFRTVEAAFEKERADFERTREEFNRKQQAYQIEEQKYREAEQRFAVATQEKSKVERQTASKVDSLVSHAEFEKKRLERQLEQKQRELRTEQIKMENARRDLDIFTRDVSRQAANDNHAPGRQLYNRL